MRCSAGSPRATMSWPSVCTSTIGTISAGRTPSRAPSTAIASAAYARANGRRTVYTPEIVVDGRTHVVGSNPAAVRRALERAHRGAEDNLDVDFERDGDYVTVKVSGAGGAGRAAVLLFRYDHRNTVEIARGENAGKTLTYHNVVREIRRLDTWNGEDLSIMLPVGNLKTGGRDGCAVIVQREGNGAIIGAARLSLGL